MIELGQKHPSEFEFNPAKSNAVKYKQMYTSRVKYNQAKPNELKWIQI